MDFWYNVTDFWSIMAEICTLSPDTGQAEGECLYRRQVPILSDYLYTKNLIIYFHKNNHGYFNYFGAQIVKTQLCKHFFLIRYTQISYIT